MSPINQLNRRDFIVTPCALISTSFLLDTQNASAQTSSFNQKQKQSLMLAIEEADKNFDEAEQMIRGSISSVGYHTTLKSGTVHHTRSSLQYASALMASGVDWRMERAKQIMRRVIALQDQNPEKNTYGIWSWYLEEPLDKMSPPDWNWADFCAVQLLRVWIDHQDQLEDDLKTLVHDSVIHAAKSIQKRNVGPGYTNIAMMGTYVTVTVGERMNEPDIHQYGKDRLRRLHKFTMDNGSFQEYNSSTYSIVAIAELTRMLMHFQNDEDRALADEMHNLAWKHLATHFHAPTRQLAGPQSRCYSTDLSQRESTLAFLEQATGNTKTLLDQDPLPMGLEYCALDINCPDEYRNLFFELNEPREVVEIFSKESDKNPERKDLTGTTYLHPLYTLGSINRGDFWVQRRPILAYWGTPEKLTYLQVRFLKDGYDFCSAIPITVQKENRLLSVVTFATDYGDTHVSLDKVKDATIKTKDLRLRFELGGNLEGIEKYDRFDEEDIYKIKSENIYIIIYVHNMEFDYKKLKMTNKPDGYGKDIICFQSDEEELIRLDQLKDSYITFSIEIFPANQEQFGYHYIGRNVQNDVERWPEEFEPYTSEDFTGQRQMSVYFDSTESWLNLVVHTEPTSLNILHHSYKILKEQ